VTLGDLEADLIECVRCPRLVEWRQRVASEKRAAFADEQYWGRPVPGFGDPEARLVIVGLAPAAHGANRTGRMFTGDRSGDWLYRALYRAGFSSHERSVRRDSDLVLTDAWVTAAVKCAPPGNRPAPSERDNCAAWLHAELDMLRAGRVFLALGAFGYQAVWAYLSQRATVPKPRPRFAHGLATPLADGRHVLASYHPSQQNTFTGRLTEEMLDAALRRAAELVAT
jgi:uracil-DNA glycosylase family 4